MQQIRARDPLFLPTQVSHNCSDDWLNNTPLKTIQLHLNEDDHFIHKVPHGVFFRNRENSQNFWQMIRQTHEIMWDDIFELEDKKYTCTSYFSLRSIIQQCSEQTRCNFNKNICQFRIFLDKIANDSENLAEGIFAISLFRHDFNRQVCYEGELFLHLIISNEHLLNDFEHFYFS